MKKIIKSAMFAVMYAAMVSCSTFSSEEDSYKAIEPLKDLSGVWTIETVSRNGVDITNDFDFSKFKLKLNDDGSFKMENYLPFVVKTDGTWTIDDPTHPFHIVFKEEGSAEPTSVELKYPIIDGERSLLISLSPGCYTNTYVYKMKRSSIKNNSY